MSQSHSSVSLVNSVCMYFSLHQNQNLQFAAADLPELKHFS